MKRKRNSSSSSSSQGGNTKPPGKQISPAKNWAFTYFFENSSKIQDLVQLFENKKARYVFQKEICPDTGREHLQGYAEFPNKVRASQHIGIPIIHWEKARASQEKNIEYCTKLATSSGDIWSNIPLPEKIIDPLESKILYPWQQEVMDIVNGPIHDRVIHWFWEREGCVGKTALAKHIVLTRKALLVGGRATDIKYAIAQLVEKKQYPNTLLLNFTRTQENFVSYQALEEIKDGMFFSSKYEAGMVVYNTPHVICFANFPPDTTKLSSDRWHIVEIAEDATAPPMGAPTPLVVVD